MQTQITVRHSIDAVYCSKDKHFIDSQTLLKVSIGQVKGATRH